MKPQMNLTRVGNMAGRLALTVAVGAAAMFSLSLVSGSVKAVEDIDRTDDTLAELSQYIAEGHASIRGLVAMPGSSTDAALAHFEKAVETRLARLRSLNNLVEQRKGVIVWTRGFHESINVQRLEDARRAYVSAAEVVPASGLTGGLRMFDLHARRLMVTVAAMRDSAETARAQALFAAEEIVAMSLGFGGMLTAYLIWYPVFRRRMDMQTAIAA